MAAATVRYAPWARRLSSNSGPGEDPRPGSEKSGQRSRRTFARLLLGSWRRPTIRTAIALDGKKLTGKDRRTQARPRIKALADRLSRIRISALKPVRVSVKSTDRSVRWPRLARRAPQLRGWRSCSRDDPCGQGLPNRYLPARRVTLSGGFEAGASPSPGPLPGDPQGSVVCDEADLGHSMSRSQAGDPQTCLPTWQAERKVSLYLHPPNDLGTVRLSFGSHRPCSISGRLMEIGPAERVFSGPHHPYYTEAAAFPRLPAIERARPKGPRAPARRDFRVPSIRPRAGVFPHAPARRYSRRYLQDAGATPDPGRSRPRDPLPHPGTPSSADRRDA